MNNVFIAILAFVMAVIETFREHRVMRHAWIVTFVCAILKDITGIQFIIFWGLAFLGCMLFDQIDYDTETLLAD